MLDEEKKKEEEIYDKYIGNALDHGDVPYESCYGKFKKCKGNDCSEIKVTAAEDSDVLVSVKEDGKVIQHAYIVAGKSYTFTLENGTYQTFFYYGKGWNPEKFMKKSDCGDLLGGFIEDEAFGKDEPVELKNNILEYELIPQTNGNFHPAESSAEDAL